MKKSTLLLTSFLLFSLAIAQTPRYVSFNEQKSSDYQTLPKRAIINENTQFIELNYEFPGATITNKTINGKVFQMVNIEGYAPMTELGKPSVPAHNEIIALPANSSIKITITNSVSSEIEGIRVIPAQEPDVDTKGAKQTPFVIDNSFYSGNKPFPSDIAQVVEVQKLRGNSLAIIQIRPVQYLPNSNSIRVYSKLKIKIEFLGGTNFDNFANDNSEIFSQILKNIVLNSNSIPQHSVAIKSNQKGITTLTSVPVQKRYIIITHDNYKEAADTLAKWKSQLGYTVDVVSRALWDTLQVKDSIKTRYLNYTPKPDYFVIIGDQQDIPGCARRAPDNRVFYTDLYFACMDGPTDYLPEMARGRISVTSASQANSVVQKIINYERYPVNEASFYSTGLNTGEFQDDNLDGWDERRFINTNEEIWSYLSGKGYTMNRQYTTNSNITPTNYNSSFYSLGQAIPTAIRRSSGYPWTANEQNMYTEINSGRFLVVHRGHGYEGGWGWSKPFFTSHPSYNNVNTLNNGTKLPIVLSVECHSGDFSTTECLAENFTRKLNGGAAGVISSSFYSYSGHNDALAVGFIDAIWSSPGLLPTFGSGGKVNPSVNSHADIVTMGDVMNQGLLRMVQTWNGSNSSNKYQYELYHYFGDPTTRIWTSNPVTATATHASGYLRNVNSITITNSNCTNGIATLVSNGIIIGRTQLVNGAGTINYTVTDSVSAILTISARNFRPYINNLTINNRIIATPPTIQAKNIRLVKGSSSKTTSLSIGWDNGNGEFRLVKINTSPVFSAPVNGVQYTADSTFKNQGEQIVYTGNGNIAKIYSLTPGVNYWIRVYEYNNVSVYTKYTTYEDFNNPAQTDNAGSLPIELLEFIAVRKNKNVELSWKTATETNNDYFTIERSLNAKDFVGIQKVDGAGNSIETLTYNLTDVNTPDQTLYYRLKQTDYNGKFSHSDIIVIEQNSESFKFINSMVQPNGNLSVVLNIFGISEIKFSVYDITGKLVIARNENPEASGVFSTNINTSQLSDGMYVLRVQNEMNTISQKIYLTK